MYRVLIADDEDIICRGLAGMISQRTGLEVAALAEDGEIALEKARETLPDLMFVDINMPFLNGLEFIERIQDILPNVLIVIVTGYDDFEYVQKALRLGVFDYVLKPIMEDAFFEVLDKAVRKLDSMNSSRGYFNWMEQQMENNRIQMTDDFFNNLLREDMDDAELKKQMGYLKIQLPIPYMLTLIYVSSSYEKEVSLNDYSWYLECRDVIQKCFQPTCHALCFRTEKGALAVISDAVCERDWEELKQKLSSAFAAHLDVKAELICRRGESYDTLQKVFREAMEIYKERTNYSYIVQKTISTIQAQWEDSELSLQSVADALFVSAPYLSRVFHKETGENFASFLTRKRMNEAKLLLKDTNMKIYEIAQRTGYTSQHYFSNAFKKAMGISPADYRKNFLK